jgi:very-short-patch-repair endonuclease
MEFFICTHCEKQYENIDSLRKHRVRIHELNAEDTYRHYILKGEQASTCSCGCGGKTKFISLQKGYRPFVNGHNSMTSANNFHKNPEARIKGAKIRSENWANGMYRGWWQEDSEDARSKIEGIKEKLRNDKERGRRISESLQGHFVSEETKKKIGEKAKQRFIDRPELREAARDRRIKWFTEGLHKRISKPEENMMVLLEQMNLRFNFQYVVSRRLFDFYLCDYNLILEVDGDWYHSNPVKYPNPSSQTQKEVRLNDEHKNKLCEEAGIRLVRYWESDINERPEWVIQDLNKKLWM